MSQPGVYTILNLVTGRCYVGSSVHVPQRWREHLSALRRGCHQNIPLQKDWQTYGSAAFSWTLTQECSRAEAIRLEQQHIDQSSDLYNMARRAGSGPREGFRHTPESISKMSAAKKGKPKSAAHRAALSAAKSGRPCPAQSAALKGRKLSKAHCEKIALGNTGKTHTEAHKTHMREVMTGRTITWGASISAGKRGKPWSQLRRDRFDAKS